MNSTKYSVFLCAALIAGAMLLGGCASMNKVGHKSQGAWTKIQHADSKDKDYTKASCRCRCH